MDKKNILTKILILIMSIFLWNFVMSSTNPVIIREYRNVNVNFINTNLLDRQGLKIISPETLSTNVKVEGRKLDLDKFNKDKASIYAYVDLSGYKEGEVRAPIQVKILDHVSGISISNIEIKEALFNLDKIISREIPLNIKYEGTLPDGYVLRATTIQRPSRVSVSGPRSWMAEVSETEISINLNNITGDTTISSPIRVLDINGDEVLWTKTNPSIGEVELFVNKEKEVPVILNIQNLKWNNIEIFDIKHNTASITINGEKDIIDNISSISTLAINAEDLIRENKYRIKLDIPSGVQASNNEEFIQIDYGIIETIEE